MSCFFFVSPGLCPWVLFSLALQPFGKLLTDHQAGVARYVMRGARVKEGRCSRTLKTRDNRFLFWGGGGRVMPGEVRSFFFV